MKVTSRSLPSSSVSDLVGADVLRDAAGLALADVGLTDGVQQSRLAVVDVTHDGDDRRTELEVVLVALVLAVAEVEGLEQLAVLVLRGHDLHDVVHLAAEQLERLVTHRLRGGDHLTEVEQRLHQRGRVGVDLLGEVHQRRAAGQPDGLAVAVRQPHATDDRRLHVLVLGAFRPLRLATAPRRTTGTAERTCGAATLTGTATAATAGGTSATGPAAEAAGATRGCTCAAASATAAVVTATAGSSAGASAGTCTGSAATGPGPRAGGTTGGTGPGAGRARRHVAGRGARTRSATGSRRTGTGWGAGGGSRYRAARPAAATRRDCCRRAGYARRAWARPGPGRVGDRGAGPAGRAALRAPPRPGRAPPVRRAVRAATGAAGAGAAGFGPDGLGAAGVGARRPGLEPAWAVPARRPLVAEPLPCGLCRLSAAERLAQPARDGGLHGGGR